MLFPALKSLRVRLVVLSISLFFLFGIFFLDWSSPYGSPGPTPESPPADIPPSITPDQSHNLASPSAEPAPATTQSSLSSSSAHPKPEYDTEDEVDFSRTAIPGIPDKVWQSAKDNNLTDNQREWVNSWTEKNPYFRQELLTDYSGETFVRTHFSNLRPDIVAAYEALTVPILRADLLRYLIVLVGGGLWSDLDVTCEKEVASWVPAEYKNKKIDMIVGLEFDFEWREEGTEVASQFCNWVFAARPSSRHLQFVVDAVILKLTEVADANHVGINEITLAMLSDVVDVTGPKIMTITILDSLALLLDRPVDDRDFAKIKSPKLVGDVLIMPGNAFAALQNGLPDDQGDVLVTHHYEGSWKQADSEAKERKKQKHPSVY